MKKGTIKKIILKFKKIKSIKKFKKILNSKIFIALIFSFFGAFGATLIYANQSKVLANFKDNNQYFAENEDTDITRFDALHNIEEDLFFNDDEFYREFKIMQDNFDKIFRAKRQYFKELDEENLKKLKSNSNYSLKVSSKKQDNKLIYLIKYKGYEFKDIDIKVEKNFLVIQAKKENKGRNKDSKNAINEEFFANNNIYYSFLLPSNIKSKTPEIKQEQNLLKIIFTYN